MIDDKEQQKQDLGGARGGARRHRIRPGIGRHLGRLGGQRCAAGQLGDYLREFKALFESYGYDAALYGHFGDGCVHCRIDFDLRTERASQNWRSFLDEAADLVVHYGGSLSGEHGDGQAQRELLEKMYGPELIEAFREFKAIWDPDRQDEPGQGRRSLSRSPRICASARTISRAEIDGAFRTIPTTTAASRARRCAASASASAAGATSEDGVMCPSYMATREEKHSTRGRARLLFEMLHGDRSRTLADEAVEEALDLCLGLQGLQERLPGQRRHGDIQGGVPRPPLRGRCGRARPIRWA